MNGIEFLIYVGIVGIIWLGAYLMGGRHAIEQYEKEKLEERIKKLENAR